MLYDTLSGVSDSSTTNDDGTYIPDVIRYANKITLSVQIQDTSAGMHSKCSGSGLGLCWVISIMLVYFGSMWRSTSMD